MVKNYIFGKVRVQILRRDIIRLEYSKDGKFVDNPTLFVPERENFDGVDEVRTVQSRGRAQLFIGGADDKDALILSIPVVGKNLYGITLADGSGKRIYEYKYVENTGELPKIGDTPDVFVLSDNPRIILPEGGYTYRGEIKDSGYVVDKTARDVYLLVCFGDHRKLREQFNLTAGRCEFPRLSILGAWNSRYFPYAQETAKELIEKYQSRDVPLDVMVIDTDWRKACERGIGYDVNKILFPDLKKFMDFAHEKGVEIFFNDHPEPVKKTANVFKPAEVKYREDNLNNIFDYGLDGWWYDRNWYTSLISPAKGVRPETLGMYLFRSITENRKIKNSGDKKKYARPVILANVCDIVNGNYRKIYDSASHRFSVQWTGDIRCEKDDISMEIQSLIRCTDNGVAYVNADCGGHVGTADAETFIRWMQFGTFSPVFRPHCTRYVEKSREPWVYDEKTFLIVREYIKMRQRLLPYIYRKAYENYCCGAPVFRSVAYNYPSDKRAGECLDEYMLGEDVLVSPVAGRPMKLVEKQMFVGKINAKFFDNKEWKGVPVKCEELDKIDFVSFHESIADGVPAHRFSAIINCSVSFNKDVRLVIKAADGIKVAANGETVVDDLVNFPERYFIFKQLKAGEKCDLEIKYYHDTGSQALHLLYTDMPTEEKETYLPDGEWISLSDGKKYKGKKTVKAEYSVEKLPLFVRAGAIIPLARNTLNVRDKDWGTITLDYFPSKEVKTDGYVYEDDCKTTAYRLGEFRKSRYSAEFDKALGGYKVILFPAEDGLKDGLTERTVKVKAHASACGKIARATVNGKAAEMIVFNKDSKAYAFGWDGGSPDGKTYSVTVNAPLSEITEIVFYPED